MANSVAKIVVSGGQNPPGCADPLRGRTSLSYDTIGRCDIDRVKGLKFVCIAWQ